MAITGVLAAVALPAFQGYVRRARTTEAINFLGVVKMRQEAYRMEFGGYAGLTGDIGSIVFVPGDGTGMTDSMQLPWPGATISLRSALRPTHRRCASAMAWRPKPSRRAAPRAHDLTERPLPVPAALLDSLHRPSGGRPRYGRHGATFEVTSFTRDMWSSNDD